MVAFFFSYYCRVTSHKVDHFVTMSPSVVVCVYVCVLGRVSVYLRACVCVCMRVLVLSFILIVIVLNLFFMSLSEGIGPCGVNKVALN